MSQKIPWKRVAIEVVAIVGSILLAFAIDAWWDARLQQEKKQELLELILQNVRATQDSGARNLENQSADQDLVRMFVGMSEAELSAYPIASANRLILALWRPNTRQFSQGPLSGVLSSERLELIEEPRIRGALEQWLILVTELDDRARVLADFEVAVTTGLAQHEVARKNFLEPLPIIDSQQQEEVSGETVDLRAIRADEHLISEIVALVRARNTYRLYAQALDSVLTELAVALEQALIGDA